MSPSKKLREKCSYSSRAPWLKQAGFSSSVANLSQALLHTHCTRN